MKLSRSKGPQALGPRKFTDMLETRRPVFGRAEARVRMGNERAPSGPMRVPRMNLRAVSEVLVANGLDPADELAKIVKSGKLDTDVQVRVLSELLQYTQPKLKSVEVRAKLAVTGFNVNDDQARRIAEEFLAAQQATGADELPMVIES